MTAEKADMIFHPKRIWIPVTAIILITAYTAICSLSGVGSICPFRRLLNIYCITCGATRMVGSLLHLQIYQAFRYNPFIFVTSPFILFMTLVASEVIVIKKEHHKKYYICLVVFSAGAIAFMVFRNTIFPWLAPAEV